MTFPFSINQPSVNLDILRNMRDIICDSALAMMDSPQRESVNWVLFTQAIRCREAIIDCDGPEGEFGQVANALMREIFEALASACNI